jgi:hypothetical protein
MEAAQLRYPAFVKYCRQIGVQWGNTYCKPLPEFKKAYT